MADRGAGREELADKRVPWRQLGWRKGPQLFARVPTHRSAKDGQPGRSLFWSWWLGPPADALRVGGVRSVQVDGVCEGARDRLLQAREFLFDRRAMLGADLLTQFFEHGV